MQSGFAIGARVEIFNHGGFPDGTRGTVESFPRGMLQLGKSMDSEFDKDFDPGATCRKVRTTSGSGVSQFVRFDEPTDDGSGDGPYRGSEFLVEYLRLVREVDGSDRETV